VTTRRRRPARLALTLRLEVIYGARDAVPVDAFMTVKQANALANWIAAKGKNFTTIYITHGHGDH
jgi:glyoxylase-like metal-dependent hydrolase (beta-lactamase superfamily II)